MANKKSLPDSIFKRSKEIFSLAGRLGMEELKKKIDQGSEVTRQIKQAQDFAKSLKHLRGAALKVGQLLSIEARDFLPAEVVDILSSLSDGAESLPLDEIEKILKHEWSPQLRESVTELSPKAFAAASIGQVHTASFQGKKIVLKVQYPGVAKSIDSDLNLLINLSQGLFFLRRKHISLDKLFDELRDVMKGEADYLLELKAMKDYKQAISNHPEYIVPHSIDELCTSQVLAMSFEPGIKVNDWLKSEPSLSEREFFARQLLDLVDIEFFRMGQVQTDSNLGNFLFRPDEKKIVLLDFGATKTYSEAFMKEYRKLLVVCRLPDPGVSREAIIAQSENMGFIDSREKESCKDAFVEMMRKSLEPFDPAKQPFSFFDREYSQEVRDLSTKFINQIQYSAPPHQIIFLHRKLGGVFGLIKAMKVSIDLSPYWERFLQQ